MKAEKLEKIYKKNKEKAIVLALKHAIKVERAVDKWCTFNGIMSQYDDEIKDFVSNDIFTIDFDFLNKLSFKEDLMDIRNNFCEQFMENMDMKYYYLAYEAKYLWIYLALNRQANDLAAQKFYKSLNPQFVLNKLSQMDANFGFRWHRNSLMKNVVLAFKNGTFNITPEQFYSNVPCRSSFSSPLEYLDMDELLDCDESAMSDEVANNYFGVFTEIGNRPYNDGVTCNINNDEFLKEYMPKYKALYKKFEHRITFDLIKTITENDTRWGMVDAKLEFSTQEEIEELYTTCCQQNCFTLAMYLKRHYAYLTMEPLFNAVLNEPFADKKLHFDAFMIKFFDKLSNEQQSQILDKIIVLKSVYNNKFIGINKDALTYYIINSNLTDAEKKDKLFDQVNLSRASNEKETGDTYNY